MKRMLSILALVILLLSGCIGGGGYPSHYVSGHIFEKETNRPVSNIAVFVEPHGISDVTSSTGEFRLSKGRESFTVIPVSSGWTFEPKSYVVTRERHDLNFVATPKAWTPVYEDEYIQVSFVGCDPSVYASVEAFLVFHMVNKTDQQLSFLYPVFALDGMNLGRMIVMDKLAPQSSGMVRVASFEPIPTMNPTRITGSLRMLDGVSSKTLAQMIFVDVPIVSD